MWRSKENAIPFVLLLVSITPFTEKSLVYGSSSSISDRIAKRPDPLRKFRHYGGDYAIRNKDYWASAAFTGIHGYAVAGIWLLCGVGFGLFMAVKSLNGNTSTLIHQLDHSKSSNFIVLLLLLLFTTFAISGSGVIIGTNKKLVERGEKLEETIIGGGDDASRSITKVKATLQQMQTYLLPYDSNNICNLLNLTAHRLRNVSLNIHIFIQHDIKTWDRAIQTLYVVNLVVVSVNLVLLVAGLVLLTLQFRPGIIILIFSCWILTTLTWILTGVDFFFHTFIGDTCSTLKNFQQKNNSSLSDMLPCPKSSSNSVQTLEQISHRVRSFISEINSRIRELVETNEQNEGLVVLVPEVCDPFSSTAAPDYSYSPENCGNNSIPIGDLPSVLSRFVCYEANSTSEKCVADGRFLPESIYAVCLAYSQSIQDFINIYPDLSSLMKCSAVRRAFSEIVGRQCRPIEVSTQELWASMLALSLVMVVLVWLWIYKAALILLPRPVQGS